MPALVSEIHIGSVRKRRTHAKSRKGCGNCKLRRVKCDEGRPRCAKCLAYGVSCAYDGAKASPLDLDARGAFQVDLSAITTSPPTAAVTAPETWPSVHRLTASVIDASLHARCSASGMKNAIAGSPCCRQVPSWTFSKQDVDVMKRFQDRTVLTIGNHKTAPTYRDCIGHLALDHPFLMHMLLSLTLMHDAYLLQPISPTSSSQHEIASLRHWNTATALFNSVLSHPIPPSSRDAVWATGALLGAAVMAYFEPSRPEDAWPLKPAEPTDLDWLKLSEGKRAIWSIANPTRPDSMFRELAKDLNHLQLPKWATCPDFEAIPSCWKRVFDITPHTTITNSPYCFPVIILSRLHGLVPTHENILDFLYFMAYMPVDFKILLERKDPRAMLLLLWWFRKLEHGESWWVKKRAAVEGRAIEIWLEKWFERRGERLGRQPGGEDELLSQKGMALLRGTFKGVVQDVEEEIADSSVEARDGEERQSVECPVQ